MSKNNPDTIGCWILFLILLRNFTVHGETALYKSRAENYCLSRSVKKPNQKWFSRGVNCDRGWCKQRNGPRCVCWDAPRARRVIWWLSKNQTCVFRRWYINTLSSWLSSRQKESDNAWFRISFLQETSLLPTSSIQTSKGPEGRQVRFKSNWSGPV